MTSIIEQYRFEGLAVPKGARLYVTHIGYAHAVKTLIGCLCAAIAGSSTPPFGASDHGLTNRLHGMILHVLVRTGCADCGNGKSDDERELLALMAQYALSSHASGADSYANIKIGLSPAAGGATETLPLLHVWSELMDAQLRSGHCRRRIDAAHTTA